MPASPKDTPVDAFSVTMSDAPPPIARHHLHALVEKLHDVGAQIADSATQFFDRMEAATPVELIVVAIVPTLGLLIGERLERWVNRMRARNFTVWLSGSAAPFFAPLLMLLFTGIALAALRASDVEPVLLPLIFKLAMGWIAIKLVAQMSSKQSAGWVIVLVVIPITLMHMFGVWLPLTNAMRNINFAIGTTQLNLFAIFRTATLLVLLLWLTNAVLRLTERRLTRMKSVRVSNRVLITKIFQIVLYFIVFLIGLRILGVSLTALSVFSGAVGVGVGFGLQKIASNFISGIILLFEKSSEIGDFIYLADGTSGIIRAQAARYTLLDLGDGREMLIPNEDFIDQRIINSTMSNTLSQQTFAVVISFDVDPASALPVMIEAVRSCRSVLKDPAPKAYVTAFGNYGVTLSVSFWLEDAHKSPAAARSDVAIAIWRAFRTHGIPIVTQQQFLHVGMTSPEPEGKAASPKPKGKKA